MATGNRLKLQNGIIYQYMKPFGLPGYWMVRYRGKVDENFQPIPVIPPNICTHFGCSQILKPQETLYGNKCIEHNGTAKTIKK